MRSTRYVVRRKRIVFNVAATPALQPFRPRLSGFLARRSADHWTHGSRFHRQEKRNHTRLIHDRTVPFIGAYRVCRSEALELPTPVPEHLARAEVRDPPKRR